MVVVYKGKPVEFKHLFWEYAKFKEGYRNAVYKDIKGLDTIGIGHLVTGKEPFKIVKGVVYSDAQIEQLFHLDYDLLRIEPYVVELAKVGYSYNMLLAVAHFIWGHGYGQYAISKLRAGLLQKTFDATSIQTYLKANWDLKSPTNQRVNREDFTVAFSKEPWTGNFTLPS